MSANLTGIAIIGKNNEPLYLRNCSGDEEQNHRSSDENAAKEEGDRDPFGFSHSLSDPRCSMPLQLQLVAYAALDSLDEVLVTGQTKQQPVIKKSNSSMPNWVGLLLELDEQAVYGYVSATNIKYLALTKGRSEVKVMHAFLKEIHQHFISYVMNPFANTRGPITSTLFDEQVRKSVERVQKPELVVD